MYPARRPRRLRNNPRIRSLVRETRVELSTLIYPLFINAAVKHESPIEPMPGIFEYGIDRAVEEIESLFKTGLSYFLLFGSPEGKDELGSGAYPDDGIVQRAVRAIKERVPEAILFTDVCLCPFTSHGHCGVVKGGRIDNDDSVELIARTALSHAQAGADFVAPSDMMDGRVLAIRKRLDENGFQDTGILAYAAKFASAFYGPFREAAHSTPQFGDRKSHQMDPANRREALKEMEIDIEEGADMVMVKPALAYLDIIREARDRFLVPIVAYNVSGEYSLVKAAAQKGWVDGNSLRDEILLSIHRAGADIIITYFAKELALEAR
jgi:porphobilinogen synthase